MKRLAVLSLVTVLVLGLAASAMALPFPITDVRALGMGGAFVAAGEGIGAVQHNPALLGKDTTVSVALQGTARIEDNIGLSDLIDDLNSLDSVADTTQAIAILNELDQGGGVDLMATAGAGAGFGVFGISAGVTYSQVIYGAAYAYSVDASQLGILDVNSNQLVYEAIEANQIILSGAKSLGNIIVGANLRQIDATVYSGSEWLFDDPGTGISDATGGTETSESATAIDVGAVMNIAPMIDVGVMVKDVNAPEIGAYEFEPRYRVGAAVSLPMITIAADFDLTEDDEGGTKYQEWAIGAEFDIWAVALRAGMSNNSGLSDAPTLMHLGLGLGFIDFGVAYADKGDYYLAGANLSLGF